MNVAGDWQPTQINQQEVLRCCSVVFEMQVADIKNHGQMQRTGSTVLRKLRVYATFLGSRPQFVHILGNRWASTFVHTPRPMGCRTFGTLGA
jgi:hypothetical protein